MRTLKLSPYAVIFVAILMVILSNTAVSAQYKGSPVKKEKLLSVLNSRQLQTREIVAVIKSNGVDFQVTPAVEQELTSAGARPEVISMARANYRSSATAVAKGETTPTKFSGQPLTKDAIVTLLQNGVSDAQVRKNIGSRGVNFKATSTDSVEIKKAGASAATVSLIESSYVDPNRNAASNNDTGASKGTDKYDTLIDKAVVQYDVSKDTPGAISTLQEAIKANPQEARAYQQMGYMQLYGQKNFDEAEKNMREAINRGGSAVFRVFHNHDGLMRVTCQGSLFISKDTVRFESDDNKHTFETTDANIIEVKVNSFFKAFYKLKSGSFKFVLKSGESDNVKFDFAPLTDNALESKMIVRLIGKK